MIELYTVVRYPDARLTTPTKRVTRFDASLKNIVKRMAATMHHHNGGVGIAANQVGLDLQLFIAAPEGRDGDVMAFVNPKIKLLQTPYPTQEACLSFPGIRVNTTRYRQVTLSYQDLNGNHRQIKAEGLLSHIIQHEMEHLKGIVFINQLSPFNRFLTMIQLTLRNFMTTCSDQIYKWVRDFNPLKLIWQPTSQKPPIAPPTDEQLNVSPRQPKPRPKRQKPVRTRAQHSLWKNKVR